jgi:EAL domain-containing protein (putative c-di-GMP-specific phosphodiesterase class I)
MTLDGQLQAFEALLSWEDPKIGRLSPAEFIPVAEETGLIRPLGGWILRRACSDAAAWARESGCEVGVSVNVSPVQFREADFPATVADALDCSGLAPSLLELEITEGAVMHDAPACIARMAEVRRLGVRIALDDFGTGYSSLSYLRRLPVTTLKIDRSFLEEVDSVAGTPALLAGIVSLARHFNLTVVAEGVERHEQLEILRAAGCDLVQGLLFGSGRTAEEATAMVSARQVRNY